MKQSEKQDTILRFLYARRDDGKEYSIKDILEGSGVETNSAEVERLANNLKRDNFIYLNDLSRKLKKASITSKGINYCEEDSYSNKGESVTHNYHIASSPNANIVINSSQVTIDQSQSEESKKIINEIREKISNSPDVAVEKQQEILECLSEIQHSIDDGKAPKFAARSLLSLVGDIGSVTGLGLTLARLFGVPV